MSQSLSRRGIACFIAILILLGAAGRSLRAQQTLQNSSIFGTVTDASGAVIPGAKVEVTGPSLQGARSATTDDAGAYRILNIPAGVYRVVYSKEGFQTNIRSGFELTAGFSARVDVPLSAGSVSQTVEVTGQAPVIDTSTTSANTEIGRVEMDAVPSTRSMTDAVYLSPGVRPSNTPDVGGSVLGLQQSVAAFGFGGNVVTLADGNNVMQQNSEHGGPSGSGPGQLVDYDSLSQLKVISTNAEAEIGPAGPVMITTMKSGGNDFHGGAHFFIEPQWFQATNLPGGSNSNQLQHYYDFFADVGGRVIRDKLWFYDAYHLQRANAKVFGYTGPDGGQGFNLTKQDNYEGKITYQATKTIQLIGDYMLATKVNPQYMGGPSVAYASTWNYYVPFWNWKGEITWTPNPKWLIDAQGGRNVNYYSYPNQSGVDVLGNPYTLSQTTGIVTGAQRYVSQFDGGFHGRYQYVGSVSYFPSGKHSFQFGTQLYLPQQDQGYFQDHPSGDYQLLTIQNAATKATSPYQFITFNFPFSTSGKENAMGFYAKDTWRVSSKLTLTYGARFDYYRTYHEAQTAPPGPFSAGGTFPAGTVFNAKRVTPRIGAAYDLRGDGKTVIRAAYGMYNIDATGEFDLVGFNPASLTQTTYDWSPDACQTTQYTNCAPSPAYISALHGPGSTFNGHDIYITTSSPALSIVNPNLRMPFIHAASLALERAVGSSMSLRVQYVGNLEEDMYDQVYPNRPLSTFTVPFNTTYPSTDPINAGKPLTILQYPTALKSANQSEYINRVGHPDYYNSFEIAFTKRKTKKWAALAALDYTKDHRWLTTSTIFPSSNNYGESSAQPTAPYKALFPVDETWDYTFKAYVTYDLPYKVNFGVNYNFLAGQPNYAMDQVTTPILGLVTFPVNKFGSFRNPNMNLVNFRFGKVFPIKEHATIEATTELFNALNVAPGTTVNTINGSGTKAYGFTSVYLPPLIGRFGVTFKF